MTDKVNISNCERPYGGPLVSGFVVLLFIVVIAVAVVAAMTKGGEPSAGAIALAAIGIILIIIGLKGFVMLEPGEAMVLLFFGKYSGTMRRVGFSWINPS